MSAIVASYDNPEEIDDGVETAPSKRLLRMIPRYRKIVDGVNAAQIIGIDRVRAQCPHFNDWLIGLEALAAGDEPDG